MKQKGKSFNGSANSKKGLETRYKCTKCARQYKQAWTLKNHMNLCEDNNDPL